MALLTFGGLELAGRSFPQRQALLLLAYLAVEGKRERSFLAELFWPEAKRPLNNLSSALTRLRSVDTTLVEADRYTVGTRVAIDTDRFVDHAGTGRHDEALDLYRGRFLDGFAIDPLGYELQEWILDQRSTHAATARDCARRLAERAARQGRTAEAAGLAERAITLGRDAPPDGQTLAALLPILVAGSSSLAATVRAEADELGVAVPDPAQAPTAPTASTVPTAGAEPEPEPRPTDRSAYGAGLVGRGFFGREAELDELDEALAATRLVVVTGLGGVGKSQLARAAIDRLASPPTTTGHQVDCSSLESIELLPELIGQVALPDGPPVGDFDQLAAAIGHRDMVVALDGVDRLADSLGGLDELRQRCPRLRLLVTSRRPVEAASAHALTLTGLPVLDAGGGPGPALRLFASASARVQPPGSTLDPVEPAAVEICRLLDGHPLAIELAAGWLNVLTPSEIADGLAGRRSAAAIDPFDLGSGGGSEAAVESVMDGTWRLLDETSRLTLARLSVVPGGCDRTVALAVGGGDLLTLRRLADWSLVSRHDGRWYRCHALVRAHARQRLAERPDDEGRARAVLAELVVGAVSDAPMVETFESAVALEAFEDPVAALLAAWDHLVERSDDEALVTLVDPLDRALGRYGRHRTLLDVLETAAKDAADGAGPHRLRARLEMHLVWLHLRLGDYRQASTTADRLLADDERRRPDGEDGLEDDIVVELTRARSAIDRTDGDAEGALARLEAVRDRAARVSDRMAALIDDDIGLCQMVLGLYPESRQSYRSVLGWARREGSQPMIAWTLLSLGIGHLDAGEILDSLAYLLEAKSVVAVNELDHIEPYVDAKLARGHLADGDLTATSRLIESARAKADSSWEPWLTVEFDLLSARLAAARDRPDEMWTHLERGLSAAADLDDIPFVAKALVAMVELGSERPEIGPDAAGGVHLAAVVAAPDSGADFADRLAAQELLDRLGADGAGDLEEGTPDAGSIAGAVDDGFVYLRRARLLADRNRSTG